MTNPDGANRGFGGDGVKTLGDVIWIDFGRTGQITRRQYEAAIQRLEREAALQPPQTAMPLKRLADAYRERAAEI